MVLTSAAINSGRYDSVLVEGREVKIWREILQRFNEFICLKAGLFDVQAWLLMNDGTPRKRINIDAILKGTNWSVSFAVEDGEVSIEAISTVSPARKENFVTIGKLIENLENIRGWLESEVA